MATYNVHRKPVGAFPAALRPAQGDLPLAQPPPPQQPLPPQQRSPQPPLRQPSHAHSRTASSNYYPHEASAMTMSPTAGHYPPPAGYPPAGIPGHTRRTASTATASTTSSHGGPGRMPSTVSISLRRTTSSRSGQSVNSTSYVALMRKQKATVWCDRAQYEDPRIAAQAKAAKVRATMEVVGATSAHTLVSAAKESGGVRSKIRHHGASKPVGYSPATLLVGAQGVPARLSASEVGDEARSDDDGDSGRHLPRAGSSRSSMVGGTQRLGTYGSGRAPGRLSTGSTPPSGPGVSPSEAGEVKPLPAGSYFASDRASKASGSSGEERKFGGVGALEAPAATAGRNPEGKTAEELSRRGSVDERAMTMRGPRLFVANPDLSD